MHSNSHAFTLSRSHTDSCEPLGLADWKLNHADHEIIALALQEDLGSSLQDVTTDRLFTGADKIFSARIISKHPTPLVLCGLPVVHAILARLTSVPLKKFAHSSNAFQITTAYHDGQIIAPGQTLLTLHSTAKTLLSAERTILNFLQRLCAIATLTAQYTAAVKDTALKILDTRKTTPGLRHLEKYAVYCGGGVNHRLGLYDAIMIKDTHIDLLGGMQAALNKLATQTATTTSFATTAATTATVSTSAVTTAAATTTTSTASLTAAVTLSTATLPVIVEVRSLAELAIVLEHSENKITRILLDNMAPDLLSECVALCRGRLPTEASGNLSLENIKMIAATGVDFASIGKLTHSAGSVDLSMQCDFS